MTNAMQVHITSNSIHISKSKPTMPWARPTPPTPPCLPNKTETRHRTIAQCDRKMQELCNIRERIPSKPTRRGGAVVAARLEWLQPVVTHIE